MPANDNSKGQYDGFQLLPGEMGSDWVFSGDKALSNQAPGDKISNPQYYFVEGRYSGDRTRVTFGYDSQQNPEREVNDGYLGHGVDWSLFNYNPYGGRGDGKNPNFRIMNDWLDITGLGDIDVENRGFSDKKEVSADGMLQYHNYPTEGYSSFGKTTGGASPDKTWKWNGNTWIPAS